MGSRYEITCDGCGADITYTGNTVDYRLVLASESKPYYPGSTTVTCMGISPAIESTLYFCRLHCMDNWTDRRRHQYALYKAFSNAWREEHGHKEPDGRISLWTAPPADIQEAKSAEFEQAALDAFPMSGRKKANV